MKKILSAVALASLAFGTAFADAKMSLNYRTQAFAYQYDSTSEIHNYLNLEKYGAAQDDVTFKASSDAAGITVTIDPYTSFATNAGSFKLNEYSAYVKLGNFQLDMGQYKNGKSNGNFQLKNDADACNLGGESWAAYKLGSIYAKTLTTFIDDSANVNGGDTQQTAMLTYKKEFETSTLTLTGSLIGVANWDSHSQSGFALKADLKCENVDHQFVLKSDNEKNLALGYHLLFPTLIPSTNLVLGGAFGIAGGTIKEYNFDVRARYAEGDLSVTFFTNYSWTTTASALGKAVGAYAGSYALYDASKTYTSAMWNLLAMRYKIADKQFLIGQIGDIIPMKGSELDSNGIMMFIMPGFQVFAGGKTSITTGLRLGLSNIADDVSTTDVEYSFSVPLVMRVRL